VVKVRKLDEDGLVEDAYSLALHDLDMKRLQVLWVGWTDIFNNYLGLYDLLLKNMEKIINPRSINTTNMY